jgi:small-conductance mechanosensitive channel
MVIRDIGEALYTALGSALSAFFTFIPRLIGAIVILLIGLFVGRLVGGLVARALRAVKFDQIADRAGIDDFLRNAGVRLDPAGVVGAFAKWAIYLIFFQVAASTLGFPQLTAIINDMIAFIPRIVVALAILLIGALVGNLLAGVVRGSLGTARVGNPNLLANLARWGVLAFAIVAALSQLQIAPAIVNTLWTALIFGLMGALALAFGLGGRDAAGSVAAGQLIRNEIQPGMQIGVDGQGGTVEQVGAVYTTVRTGSGAFKIPNAELARQTVLVAGSGPARPGQEGPGQPTSRQGSPQSAPTTRTITSDRYADNP